MNKFRDIKPDNILLNRLDGNLAFNLRLIDFGSAIDPISIERYYGNEGPSDAEQTSDYAPPEAIFHKLNYIFQFNIIKKLNITN